MKNKFNTREKRIITNMMPKARLVKGSKPGYFKVLKIQKPYMVVRVSEVRR